MKEKIKKEMEKAEKIVKESTKYVKESVFAFYVLSLKKYYG